MQSSTIALSLHLSAFCSYGVGVVVGFGVGIGVCDDNATSTSQTSARRSTVHFREVASSKVRISATHIMTVNQIAIPQARPLITKVEIEFRFASFALSRRRDCATVRDRGLFRHSRFAMGRSPFAVRHSPFIEARASDSRFRKGARIGERTRGTSIAILFR